MNTTPTAPQDALINKLDAICDEIFERWDKDQRSGKLLAALAGRFPNYRKDVDEIRAALSTPPVTPSPEAGRE